MSTIIKAFNLTVCLFICTVYLSAQDIEETFLICSGESVFFTAPDLGGGPESCNPEIFEIIRKETGEKLTNGENGFQFKPTVGLHTIITKGACQTVDPETGLTVTNQLEASFIYDVILDPNCSLDNDPLFADFPWLTDLVDPNNCSVESIDVYQSGVFNYLMFNRRSFDRTLYFQDGTKYCQYSSNFDCVSLYNLGDPIDSWTCGENIGSADDCEITIVNTECRVINVFDSNNNFLTSIDAKYGGPPRPEDVDPEWTDPTPLNSSETRTYIFKTVDLVVGSQTASCAMDRIEVVSDFNSSCTDALGLESFTNTGCLPINFRNIYGGEFQIAPGETVHRAQSIPLPLWIVTVGSDTLTILDSFAGSGPVPIFSGGCDSEDDDQIFIDFPWLSSVISPGCSEGIVQVFQSGIFNFLFIRSEGVGRLYFQDGTFYCQNSNSNDCLSAYGLSNPIAFWECNTGLEICEVIISNTQCKPIGIFDEFGNILTTIEAASLGEVPEQIIPEWSDPSPLAFGEVREYTLKDGLLTIGVTSATCQNSNINTSNQYASACNDGLSEGTFINTGCRVLDVYNTRGELLFELEPISIEPEATLTVTITNEIFIFVAEGDTIAIMSEIDGDINSGGCLTNILPNSIPENFTDYDVIYRICKGDSLVIDTPNKIFQCQLPPICFTTPIICENFPELQDFNWSVLDGDMTTDPPVANFATSVFSPLETTSYVGTFSSARCGFGPAGPLSFYTYLVVVEDSDNCDASEFTSFDIEACFGDTITIPIPDHGGICEGTFGQTSAIDIVEINANFARGVVQNEGQFFYQQETDFQEYTVAGFKSNSASCPDVTYEYNIHINSDCIFQSYEWLPSIVDDSACTDQTVKIYQAGIFKYLLVTNSEGQILYNEDGLIWCTNGTNFDCVEAYNLGSPILTWACIDDPAESCVNTGTVFLLPCGNGEFFYFIQSESGELLDLYLDSTVNYNPLDGQKVNFDFVEADFASPCSTADKAVTVTCIDFNDNPIANQDCNILNAEIITRPCDDGSLYFFLLTESGDILDAYLAEGVDYQLEVGMLVDVGYENAHFDSPCSIANDAVIITCIQDAGDVNTSDLIFEEFSFLTNLVDPNSCHNASIEVYDQGAFAFLFVRYNDNEGGLYLDDGTLYCVNTPTNHCLDLYGLSNPDDVWSCSNLVNDIRLELVKENTVNTTLEIYPNPTHGVINIQVPSISGDIINLQIINVIGQVVRQIDIPKVSTGLEYTIDLSNAETGVYYIRLTSKSESFIQKIFKQ